MTFMARRPTEPDNSHHHDETTRVSFGIVGSSGPARLYSPNLNLIERLWKFLRKKALNRWHRTFEAMQEAVAAVLDHLGDYRDELATLMTERFPIVEVKGTVV